MDIGSVEFLLGAGGDKLVLPSIRGDLRLGDKADVIGVFFVIIYIRK